MIGAYAVPRAHVSGMRNQSPGTVVLYDGDCRICTTFAHWVSALDVRGGLEIRTIQSSKELLRALPGEEILEAMHVVASDGRLLTGGDGLPALLSALVGPPVLEALLTRSSIVRALVRRLYSILAEFRGHLTCRFDGSSFSSAARSLR